MKKFLGLVLVLSAATIAIVYLFPSRTGAWILNRTVPYPARFSGARFSGAINLEYAGLEVDHPSARFSSEAASLVLAPRAGSPTRVEGALKGVLIRPRSLPLAKPIAFESALFSIEPERDGARRISLTRWRSPDLDFDGKILLDKRSRVAEFEIEGLVRLTRWKGLLPGSEKSVDPGSVDDSKLPFQILLKEGFLEVLFNGKTVFRSRWTMKKV